MNLDIRTKNTVTEGIVNHIQGNSGITHEIRYYPGNGTCYNLVFVKFEHYSEWLVTHINTMRSMMVIKSNKLLHYNYVSEKLGCSTADGVCLAEIIGHVTERPYVTCEEIKRNIADSEHRISYSLSSCDAARH